MACGSFHGEYRSARMLDELLQYHFVVIVFLAFETCERTYADDVAIAAHHGNGFQQVFRFVTVHDDATFRFQFPGSLVDIQYNHVHAQIQCGLLCTEAGTQAGVEENHHQRFVTSQFHIFETVFLNLECFVQCRL